MIIETIVKYMNLDDESRIIIGIQDTFQSYLADKENVKQLRSMISSILGEDMSLFESSSKTIRLTVTSGKEEEIMEKLKLELLNAMSMAMDFMKNSQEAQ